jgi:aryl-alcohol dehydrogenase-like predicted oxidoreductase
MIGGGLGVPSAGSIAAMRYVEVGGVRLSAIGLGTWQFGSRAWGYGRGYADGEAVAIVRRALELGVNLVDTAEIYAWGRSERIVGRAVRGADRRPFLATKLYPALPVEPVVVRRGVGSARRLGVDRIDLYQVHAPNPAVPIGTTMRGMARLRRMGRIDRVGVSNFSLDGWRRAEAALGDAVLSNQVRYSLAVRDPEHELLPWAQANDRLVIAYSPLAQGLLSGAYGAGEVPRDVRAQNPLFLPDSILRSRDLLAALRSVAAAHDATPAQVALAWLVRRPNVVAIPGARTVAQLEANVAAADLQLDDAEDRALTEASDRFRPTATTADVRRHRLRKLLRR